MSVLTREEQKRLDFYNTPEGEKEWRYSDLAYADYQRLLDKEARERYNREWYKKRPHLP